MYIINKETLLQYILAEKTLNKGKLLMFYLL